MERKGIVRRQRQNLQENSNQGSQYLRDVVSSGSCKTTGDHPQLATSNTLVSLIPLLEPGWKSYLPLNRYIQRYILATETMPTWILPATEMTRALPLERLQKDSIRLLASLWQFPLKERMEMVSTRIYPRCPSSHLPSSWLHFEVSWGVKTQTY